MRRAITIVQGGCFGSEAKGAVAHALCQRLGISWAVRTGSINAGHSVITDYGDGPPKKVAFQQLPVAAALPGVNLVIGPGAYVHRTTLERELLLSHPDRGPLYLDRNCGVHLDDYTREASVAARSTKIGATGKGCAEAIVHKITDRGVGRNLLLMDHHPDLDAEADRDIEWADTAEMLNRAYDRGQGILLEGTQGSLLDFHLGPYPFVTSRQCTAAAWVAESGLSPSLDYNVVLVARTYPIRVAGPSGPMGVEIDWPTLARRMNNRLRAVRLPEIVPESSLSEFERYLQIARDQLGRSGASAEESSLTAATTALRSMPLAARNDVMRLFETTTVTQRLRRIAELDVDQLRRTVLLERPTYVVLTFLNYVFPELSPEHNPARTLHPAAEEYVEGLQDQIGCRIGYVTLGPRAVDMVAF